MSLTSKRRAQLRAEAHELKPLVQIGKEGVNEATSKAVREALRRRALLKVRVLDGAPDGPRETAEKLVADVIDLEVVQIMGRTLTLFRPNPDVKKA